MEYIKHYSSPIGRLEIIATDDFLTQLFFGEEQKNHSSRQETTLERSPVIEECTKQLDAYFTNKLKNFDLPLQPKGTDFQRNVWEWLKAIPYGKTVSYLEFSRKIGNEKAIRAVATANGNNPLIIILPCHRVIGSDGRLVGYSGNLWRKKWLLRHEGGLPNQKQLDLF